MMIYRWIEGQLGPLGGSCLPCGGRTALLKLYERRLEFAASKVVFVADRDMWLYLSVPSEYVGIIFTEGYSIENDIYCHSDIERLLDPDEVPAHRSLLEMICRWFAFEVEEALANREPLIDTHINAVVPIGATDIDPGFVVRRGFVEPHPDTWRLVLDDYQRNLRGKQLFELLQRIMTAPNRAAKRSTDALLEDCVKTRNHPNIARLINEIRARLA